MTIYVENPKELIRNLLQLISNYSKVAQYKVNMQVSITFIYTSKEQMEFEIKNTMPFMLAQPHWNTFVLFRHTYNKICSKSIWGIIKLYWTNSKNNKINGEVFPVQGKEDSVSSRCPLFPIWLMQLQWKFQLLTCGYRHTLEIFWVQFQTATIKCVSQ